MTYSSCGRLVPERGGTHWMEVKDIIIIYLTHSGTFSNILRNEQAKGIPLQSVAESE